MMRVDYGASTSNDYDSDLCHCRLYGLVDRWAVRGYRNRLRSRSLAATISKAGEVPRPREMR